MSLLTDELRGWIGRTARYDAPDEIGRAAIRYFAQALGDDNPLYRDEDFARAAGHPSIIAPPTLICETCQYADGQPGENGYIGHEWDLPVENMRLIRAGNDYEFFQPATPDDRLTVIWTLSHIEERASRRGGTQLFVTSDVEYRNQHDQRLATNRETIVLQPIEPEPGDKQ